MVGTVWLTRHGNRQDFVDPDWPKSADRPYDPGLSPDGVVQAQQLAERMEGEPLGGLFASPFLRTVETANEIAEVMDLPIYIEPQFSEWMNPEWFPGRPETLSMTQLVDRFPRIDASYASRIAVSYPETEAEAMERSADAARRITENFPEPVLLVGHGVSVVGAAIGLDEDAFITECGLCSLFKLVRHGQGWEMTLCGDVAHLDELVAGNRFI